MQLTRDIQKDKSYRMSLLKKQAILRVYQKKPRKVTRNHINKYIRSLKTLLEIKEDYKPRRTITEQLPYLNYCVLPFAGFAGNFPDLRVRKFHFDHLKHVFIYRESPESYPHTPQDHLTSCYYCGILAGCSRIIHPANTRNTRKKNCDYTCLLFMHTNNGRALHARQLTPAMPGKGGNK